MARNKHHQHWFGGLEELEKRYPHMKELITGDRVNGVTRIMDYSLYDGATTCFSFKFQKRELLAIGGAYFEEVPDGFRVINTMKSGAVVLEKIQPKPDQL